MPLSKRLREFVLQLSPEERRKRRRALIFLAFIGPPVEVVISYFTLRSMGADMSFIVVINLLGIPTSLLFLKWLMKAVGLTSKQLGELDNKTQNQT